MDLPVNKERQFMQHTSKNKGFTLPELMVVIAIGSLVIASILGLIVNLARVGSSSIDAARQVKDTQSAMRLIQADLRLTQKFLMQPSIADSPPGGGSWNFRGTGSTNRALLLQTAATTANSVDANRTLVYKQTGGCPIGTTPAYNNVIYFVRSSTLYRRIVVEPPVANLYCPGQTNAQIRTCTTPGTPANCQLQDVVVATDITGFNILYYTNPGDNTPSATIYDSGTAQAVLDTHTTAKILLTSSKDIDGQSNEFTAQARLSRIQAN
ncbi:TPA: hypothetical protein DEW05_05220 [Candidatus Saccharibacteria bacterium]|nr:hypothetical protein [Candidatus Saccharibacteria bacterium]